MMQNVVFCFALSDFPLYFLVLANLLIFSALSVKCDFKVNLSFRLLFFSPCHFWNP